MVVPLCHHSLRVREASEVLHSIYIEASNGLLYGHVLCISMHRYSAVNIGTLTRCRGKG